MPSQAYVCGGEAWRPLGGSRGPPRELHPKGRALAWPGLAPGVEISINRKSDLDSMCHSIQLIYRSNQIQIIIAIY